MPQSNVGSRRKKKYLVQAVEPDGFEEFNVDFLQSLLNPAFARAFQEDGINLGMLSEAFTSENAGLDITPLQTLEPGGGPDRALVGAEILQVEGDEGDIEKLRSAFQGRLLVEEDFAIEPFTLHPPVPDETLLPSRSLDFAVLSGGGTKALDIRVVDQSRATTSVVGAQVYLITSSGYQRGLTGEDGKVRFEIPDSFSGTISGLLISPQAEYWSRWIDDPDVTFGKLNKVGLQPIGGAGVMDGFWQEGRLGWGQLDMGLAPDQATSGDGIRVAIIDSGLDTAHADLNLPGTKGRDFTTDPGDDDSWQNDVIGHGSHVAGIIMGQVAAAGGTDDEGIRGFAPSAETVVMKVFPGGTLSSLVKSLRMAANEQADIVNLSLGSARSSEILHREMQAVRRAGLACIAAAGNSASPVMYPAAYPEVLAVSAIGKTGTAPDDSRHARQKTDHVSGPYFAARFTCYGPEIDVCGPGVAIVSAVPGSARSYAAWDGTSMACPHIAGLAVLLLESRDDIRAMTGEARVAALFDAIKSASRHLPGIPEEFQGAGLPQLPTKPSPDNGGGTPVDDHTKRADAILAHLTSALDLVEAN